jgi:predicted nucleotidyltransferase component of viral defense system
MHTLVYNIKNIVDKGKEEGYEDSKILVMVKEFLQDILLYIIYNNKESANLVFYGGSSLRKIYNLDRFSEDLDFENPLNTDVEILPGIIEGYFNSIDFDRVECKVQKSKNITRNIVKFEIANEVDLSGYKNEKIHVKIEVNTESIKKYPTELTSKMLREYSLVLRHYDLSTLFACKIIACLNRKYFKSRDFYDLIWFFNNTKVLPNEQKLLDYNEEYDIEKVIYFLDEKVENITTEDLLEDLQYFFEDGNYIKTWCENFHKIYESSKKRMGK